MIECDWTEMIEEACKDACTTGSLEQFCGCDLTEADDKTAEKEVKIVTKEVVGGAPPLARTLGSRVLTFDPDSKVASTLVN